MGGPAGDVARGPLRQGPETAPARMLSRRPQFSAGWVGPGFWGPVSLTRCSSGGSGLPDHRGSGPEPEEAPSRLLKAAIRPGA